MAKHPFLSDEWIEAAKKIREEMRGTIEAPPTKVKANLNVTDSPISDGTIEAHMDSSSGEMEMDIGHMEGAEVTVTVDYATAKAIFVDQNPQAGMQAFMAGKIKVQGDMTKLMAMGQAAPDAGTLEMANRIKEITAD